MGVKDLWEILSPAKEEVDSSDLRGKTLAVDLSGWVVAAHTLQFKGSRSSQSHLRNVFFKTSSLLRSGVQIMAVIDGAAPESKISTLQQRSWTLKRKRCSVAKLKKKQQRLRFRESLEECVGMLKSLGVPCVQSPSEAEATCAWLEMKKFVDGCITQDSDVFLYGARNVYRNLNVKSGHVKADHFSMVQVADELKLDREKLICLALLLGCDFSPGGVEGVGKEMALDLLDSFHSDNSLKRLTSWRYNEELKQIEKRVPLNKKGHCTRCKHPGSEESHRVTPCTLCDTASVCDFHTSEYVCFCEWHVKKRECEPYEKELKIRRKALQDPNFPQQEVIEEFLGPKHCEPGDIRHPERPDFSAAAKLLNCQLNWNYSDCIKRVLPLLTVWDIAHAKDDKCLVPMRILKQRILQGQRFFEVEWDPVAIAELLSIENVNCVVSNTTLERSDMIASAYPKLVEEFKLSTSLNNNPEKPYKCASKRSKSCFDSSDEEGEDLTDFQNNYDGQSSAVETLAMTLRSKKYRSYKECEDSS